MTDTDALDTAVDAHFFEATAPADTVFRTGLIALRGLASHLTRASDTAEQRAQIWPTAPYLRRTIATLNGALEEAAELVGFVGQRAQEIARDDPTVYDDRGHPDHPASDTAARFAAELADASQLLRTAARRIEAAHDTHVYHLGHN